jgi:hypothetical protein
MQTTQSTQRIFIVPSARAKADQVFALDRAGKTREAIAKEVLSLQSLIPGKSPSSRTTV